MNVSAEPAPTSHERWQGGGVGLTASVGSGTTLLRTNYKANCHLPARGQPVDRTRLVNIEKKRSTKIPQWRNDKIAFQTSTRTSTNPYSVDAFGLFSG